jgi:hypothetical protein
MNRFHNWRHLKDARLAKRIASEDKRRGLLQVYCSCALLDDRAVSFFMHFASRAARSGLATNHAVRRTSRSALFGEL